MNMLFFERAGVWSLLTILVFFSFREAKPQGTEPRPGRSEETQKDPRTPSKDEEEPSEQEEKAVEWKVVTTIRKEDGQEEERKGLIRSDCTFDDRGLPVRTVTRKLGNRGSEVMDAEVEFERLESEKLSDKERKALGGLKDSIPRDPVLIKEVVRARKVPYLKVSYLPLFRDSDGKIRKLLDEELRVGDLEYGSVSGRSGGFASNSVLSDGAEWYRLGVTESGMHEIDRALLEEIGVDPDSVTTDRIDIYGNGFGRLPFSNSEPRPDDLKKNAIEVQDGGDGRLDPGDRVLFYAKGPHVWDQNSLTQRFEQRRHLYSDSSYYFLRIGGGTPKRVQEEAEVNDPYDQVVEKTQTRAAHERESINLIHSGRQWAGEEFDGGEQKNFDFSMPGLISGSEVHVRTRFLARTLGNANQSSFSVSVNGSSDANVIVSGVPDDYQAAQGSFQSNVIQHQVSGSEDDVEVSITFQPHSPSSRGWLDRIEVNAERELRFFNDQMVFWDTSSVGSGEVSEFRFQGSGDVDRIWDVSNPTEARSIPFDRVNGEPRFRVETDSLREFLAFDESSSFPNPEPMGKVAEQNLHAASQPDFVILSASEYLPAAEELAEYRRQEGMDVLVTTPRKVYNEFSSGIRDVTAIKDLMRMFYERAGNDSSMMPEHLLLFGDGSFDNRLNGMDDHLIPTFQSANSTHPTQTFTSDDYFGLLDPNEGQNNSHPVDLGIGRIPVRSLEQAREMVQKVKDYEKEGGLPIPGGEHCEEEELSMRDPNWRDRMVFIADDEDNNRHMVDADDVAKKARNRYPVMNQEKLYIDAFQQVRSAGGERYPEVNERIDERMARGALIIDYVGHGGERGWAQERILTQGMINEWENADHFPLFVTATCEFTRFDDHSLVSAGENVLLNAEGGGIGLLSTTRLVFASENKVTNLALFDHVLERENGEPLRIGEVVRRTKLDITDVSSNHRKFLYFGDPTLRLDLPEKRIEVDSIDASPVGAPMDTVHALSEVSVSGSVQELNGQPDNSFEGVVHPLVMDKEQEIETLANDNASPFNFKAFNSTLHRGKASVENGKFHFSFVVPKDIAYQYGKGRVSLLAEGEEDDAHGFTEDLVIGGTDPNARDDDRGPEIDIFLNDRNFVPGGTTDESPLLIGELSDESGINISNSGIGHNIEATLNGESSNSVVLNEHYRSELDTYKEGEVRYRFSELDEGEHELELKAWDVHNNPTERKVDFVVANSAEMALEHVLNYPNPFTTHTEFFFEHNQACRYLDVQIRIFTVSGKVVKTIDETVHNEGFRSEGIAWDGTDEYGDPLGKGVYVYELKVRTPEGKKANEFEKLVLLK